MKLKRWLFCYVDDKYIGPVYTAWSIARQLSQLRKRYPNARNMTVSAEHPSGGFKVTYKDWAMEQLKRVGN